MAYKKLFVKDMEPSTRWSSPGTAKFYNRPDIQVGGAPCVDKYRRIMNILLKLASIGAYNEYGEIRGSHGRFIPRSDIIKLISISFSKDKQVAGEDEYIYLLSRAKVDPTLLTNDRIRRRLEQHNTETPELPPNVLPDEVDLPEIEPLEPLTENKNRLKLKRRM